MSVLHAVFGIMTDITNYGRAESCSLTEISLIIDGREVTWDEFGRMLMSFEGWQLKLNLADKSEEL